ncbi:hypothetical protein [Sediminibacillus halophilus]|uniref:Uncharacterized protein n=1 Tax=Sediminibacillus halophilus TaxID=482461 RepID=A0A1G9TAR7_9BACI|nr:hypothetical protein [Sediminibacillus halophilus]SDM44718.1 hypothetical protein SAMN05216244_2507 [Sediminibacillus halophilus]
MSIEELNLKTLRSKIILILMMLILSVILGTVVEISLGNQWELFGDAFRSHNNYLPRREQPFFNLLFVDLFYPVY